MALRYAGRESNFFARVDTGASFCIFQRLRAETVGIVVGSGAPMRMHQDRWLYLSHYDDFTDDER